MRQIHKDKHRPRSSSAQQAPLPADPRDPDIVHAHQVARRTRRAQAQPGGRAKPISGRR
jgi:hypothetical protein